MKYIAVITCDIKYSKKLISIRAHWFKRLREIFDYINKNYEILEKEIEIVRGDNFQFTLKQPENALKVALLIKAHLLSIDLKKFNKKKESLDRIDARIAIGIGTNNFTSNKMYESDGDAYWRSGKLLDELKKKNQSIGIRTGIRNIDDELEVLTSLADVIINKWSIQMAEVVKLVLMGTQKQSELSEALNISQPSVHERLKGAGFYQIWEYENRFSYLLNSVFKNKSLK